jgi:hypothetical protein
MKTAALLVLTALFGMQSGPTLQELLEKLGASRAEEREEAAAKLLELGPGCLPELERAAKEHPDEEVRARIRGILEEVQRRKRIAVLRPPPTRLSIDLEGVPPAEAAEKLFRPFGVQEFPRPPKSERRTVSVHLNRATFWQAYDAFFSGWKAKPNMRRTLVDFVGEGYSDPGFAKVDFDDLRIAATPTLGLGIGEMPLSELYLQALLPPGTFASSCEFEGVEVFDDRGKNIDTRNSGSKDEFDRDAGSIVTAGLWWAWFNPDHLKDAKSLEVRGTVVLGLPRDLRRFEMDLRNSKLPSTQDCGGFTLEASAFAQKKPGRWELRWKVEAGKEAPQGVLSVEGSDRRWLKDFYWVHRARPFEFPYIHEGDRPEWLVLTRLIGEERVRYPFVVKGVPVPPRPNIK